MQSHGNRPAQVAHGLGRVLITVQAVDSHVRAMQPVALQLMHLGSDVRVAAPDSIGKTLRDTYGLDHVSAGSDWMNEPGVSTRLANLLAIEGNTEFCRVVISEYLSGNAALKMARDLIELGHEWRPDVILRDCTDLGAYLAGEALGVRVVTMDNGFVRLMDRYHEQVRPELIRHRAALGLGPEPDGPPDEVILTPSPRGFLLPDYPAESVVEYRHENAQRQGEGLPRWVNDLPADRPLIYVSLGSILTCGPGLMEMANDLYERIIAALSGIECTAVVSVGPGIRARLKAPPHVRIVARISQPLLLQAGTAAFLTHCGFSSLRESMHSGVKLVGLPISSDQPENAARCSDLGLGPSLATNATPAEIRAATLDVLSDNSYDRAMLEWQRRVLTLPSLSQALPLLLG
jgi:N-glycosyltransferase